MRIVAIGAVILPFGRCRLTPRRRRRHRNGFARGRGRAINGRRSSISVSRATTYSEFRIRLGTAL